MYFSTTQLLVLALIVGGCFFYAAKMKAEHYRHHQNNALHSMPVYHGSYVFLWTFIPVLLLVFIWLPISRMTLSHRMIALMQEAGYEENMFSLVSNAVLNKMYGLTESVNSQMQPILEGYKSTYNMLGLARTIIGVILMLVGGFYAYHKLAEQFRARNRVERYIRWIMIACATIAVITTFGIVLSVLFESIRFFNKISPQDFFFNTLWSPQTALRADQVGSSGSFGVIPLLVGTFLISIIALLVAVPIGLMSAIYLSEYAPAKVRAWAKPMLEILAGIPTVVYGFFAALTVAPLIRNTGQHFGLSVSSESALAAGLVMGIMIIPFVSSLSDDVISAVPQSLREGSYGLGATKSETIKRVILPAALPGIVSSVLLAASRAIGETMIVVMAAGLSANLTINPLKAVTTVTVQIVTLLQGDQEFDSAKTLAAFALGLTLFVITFLLNLYALHIVKKYREQYD